tara:strand:+ start:6406 stop:6642 length:237 start_codon:yes stop_codon:yes gene_type:complete
MIFMAKDKKEEEENVLTLDLNKIELDELLISVGGVLFSGAEIEELDEILLIRLEELIKAELIIRENDIRPPKGEDTIH